MELVIEIPNTIYNNIIDIPESSMFSIDCDSRIRRAIENGTPLPKGHGALKDVDKLLVEARYRREDGVYVQLPSISVFQIINAPTIIEASKEVAEMEQNESMFPCIEGALAEMYVDGKWIKGKIIKGYRFDDGIVTIEDDNGKQYWCGQARTDLYRPYKGS